MQHVCYTGPLVPETNRKNIIVKINQALQFTVLLLTNLFPISFISTTLKSKCIFFTKQNIYELKYGVVPVSVSVSVRSIIMLSVHK